MERRCYILLSPRHAVPIRCCGDVPLRHLSDVPPRRRLVLYLRHTFDVAGTSRQMSLRRHYDVVLPVGISVTVLIEKCKKKPSKVNIRKKEVRSKSIIKTHYGSKFLVSEYIFIVKVAGDQRLVVQEISLKNL